MRGRRATALAVSCLVVVLGVQRSVSADPVPPAPKPVAHGTALSDRHPVLTFSGSFQNPTPLPTISDPEPTVCAFDCQEWRLNVETSMPFLVSIKNKSGSIEDGLNLYVDDPSGHQVGSSEGVGSNGQAVEVKPASKGAYGIVVTVTYQYDPKVVYLGEARIMTPPSWTTPQCSSPCPMLPRLR